MARIRIDRYGDKIYNDDNRDYHREDGPAVIRQNGEIRYRLHGWPLPIDGNPTDVEPSGEKHWFTEQYIQYRMDKPAIENPNGYKQWYNIGGVIIWPKLS